jgi:hypothetical protein
MPLPHRARVSRRDGRGYDPTMTLARLLLPACLAAFAAAVVRAESEQSPRFKDEASPNAPSLVSPDAPALPGRYGREGYSPSPGDNARSMTPRRYDAREQRIESLRNRYPMPREMSQDMHAAIEQAQRAHGGKVLSADRMHSDGRDVYRVKLLTPGGRVRIVQLQKPESSPAPEPREQQGEQ